MMGDAVKWFPYYRAEDAGIKVFCFAHAGADARAFYDWNKKAQTGIQVIPIEVPGKGTRYGEVFIEKIDELAKMIALEIFKFAKDDNFILYGHSLGAIEAFQVAYILENKYARKPKLLAVSGCSAPFDDVENYKSWMGEDALIAELKKSRAVEIELLEDKFYREFFLPIIIRDYRLREDYQYAGEIISSPIIAFSSEDDEGATPDIMAGWKDVTVGEFTLTPQRGSHMFVYEGDFFKKFVNVVI